MKALSRFRWTALALLAIAAVAAIRLFGASATVERNGLTYADASLSIALASTQGAPGTRVLAQFAVRVERFRRAPVYDFARVPAATVWYERLGWGITAADLAAAAREASAALGLPPAPGRA